jgi:hypothetical protein
MIDSYTDIILRAGDATPNDIVLRTPPSPRNPMNRYADASQVQSGVSFGAGLPLFQNYETGTYVGGGGGACYRPIGSSIIRRMYV